MPKFKPVVGGSDNLLYGYRYECPGCANSGIHGGPTRHVIPVTGPHAWQFNGDVNCPTLSPSILSRWTYGPDKITFVCHHFVKDGMIQYLSDCTHALAGQTLELPDILDNWA